MTRAARTVIDEIGRFANSVDGSRDFIYLNYALPPQNPIRNYGETNVQRMLEVSRRYDPRQIFQLNVPGGFKLKDA